MLCVLLPNDLHTKEEKNHATQKRILINHLDNSLFKVHIRSKYEEGMLSGDGEITSARLTSTGGGD